MQQCNATQLKHTQTVGIVPSATQGFTSEGNIAVELRNAQLLCRCAAESGSQITVSPLKSSCIFQAKQSYFDCSRLTQLKFMTSALVFFVYTQVSSQIGCALSF